MILVNQHTEARPFDFGGILGKLSRSNSNFGWFEMNLFGNKRREVLAKTLVVTDFHKAANDICEQAMKDAKEGLHPLMQKTDPIHLRKRSEFVQALKFALGRRIAQKLAVWQPSLESVFQFDESWIENRDFWDGSLHLLVKVPRLSNTIKIFGKQLDQHLTTYLKQLGWSRFRARESILEIQQVTSYELRHGIGYGAMFHAVYSVPVKVWPLKRTVQKISGNHVTAIMGF